VPRTRAVPQKCEINLCAIARDANVVESFLDVRSIQTNCRCGNKGAENTSGRTTGEE